MKWSEITDFFDPDRNRYSHIDYGSAVDLKNGGWGFDIGCSEIIKILSYLHHIRK